MIFFALQKKNLCIWVGRMAPSPHPRVEENSPSPSSIARENKSAVFKTLLNSFQNTMTQQQQQLVLHCSSGTAKVWSRRV
jgi:hypothetical protein